MKYYATVVKKDAWKRKHPALHYTEPYWNASKMVNVLSYRVE